MMSSIHARPCFALLVVLALALLMATPVRAEEATRTYLKVVENNEAAPVFERHFDTPQEAFDYAATQSSGDVHIELGTDWKTMKQNTLSSGTHPHIFIDLKGHNIIRDTGGSQVSDGGLFLVEKDALLNIRDTNPQSVGYKGIRGGVITGGANTNGGGAFTVKDGGRLEIQGGTIYKCTTNEHGGAVHVSGKDASFTMSGGRIYFCQTIGAWGNCHGGAVYCDEADVSFNDCTVDSCYSEDNGGALYMAKGNAVFERVSMIGNHCLDYGGAIYMDQGSLKMYDSRIHGSEAKNDGGAIYDNTSAGMRLRGCVFYKNKSRGNGGALYVNDISAQLIDTDVIANSAQGYGGGVYVDSRYDIGLKGLVHIENNSGKGNRNNLTLQDGAASRAYFTNGGLYEGSRVGLSSTSRNVMYAKAISENQKKYFFSDLGDLMLRDRTDRQSQFVSSAFGEGAAGGVALGLGMAAIAGTAVYVLLSKRDERKKAKEGQR